MSTNSPNFPASGVWDSSSPDRTSDRSINASPSYEDWDQIVAEVRALQDQFFVKAINGEGGNITKGFLCYMKSDGEVALADADGSGTRFGLGLALALYADNAEVTLQTMGVMVLTTAEWDTICGTTGGLDEGVDYYQSDATAGKLTATAPATATDTLQTVGYALSPTKMLLRLHGELPVA